jgi:hypothetical protein
MEQINKDSTNEEYKKLMINFEKFKNDYKDNEDCEEALKEYKKFIKKIIDIQINDIFKILK